MGFRHSAHQERLGNFWCESCLGGMFPAVRGVTHTRVTQGWLLCVTFTHGQGGGAEREHEDAPMFLGLGVFSRWSLGSTEEDQEIWGVWDEKSVVCCGNGL